MMGLSERLTKIKPSLLPLDLTKCMRTKVKEPVFGHLIRL